MNNHKKITLKYEPEADVLSYKLSGSPIDYAKEVGNVIVHFTKDHIPVLVEILEASSFLEKSFSLVEREKSHAGEFAAVAV